MQQDERYPLWALDEDKRVPEHMRMAHRFTFDGAICPFDRAEDLSRSLKFAYAETHIEHPNKVNHWDAIADTLLKADFGRVMDKRALGFGLSCTSVSDPWGDWATSEKRKVWDILQRKSFLTQQHRRRNSRMGNKKKKKPPIRATTVSRSISFQTDVDEMVDEMRKKKRNNNRSEVIADAVRRLYVIYRAAAGKDGPKDAIHTI